MLIARTLLIAALSLIPLPVSAAALDADAKVAFLGVSFYDLSTEGAYNGVRKDETERVALLKAYIASRLAEYGFTLVALDPVADELDRVTNPLDCNGCDIDFGRRLGARYVAAAQVSKVSNLILSLTVELRDVASGHRLRAVSVDIRGNTDTSWIRGMRYALDHNIFIESGR